MRRAVVVAAVAAGLLGCGGSERSAGEASPTATATKTGRVVTIEEIEALARKRKRAAATRTPKPEPTAAPAPAVEAPEIVRAFIPFPQQRKEEMAAYAQRHYGFSSYRLEDPRVIVQHFTVTDTADQAIAIFEPDEPDSELGELPGTCAHFVIERDGTILQLVPLSIMCRHTVGLNYTAIGIEHVGFSADEVLGNDAQMASSLALTRWLQARHAITDEDVIGHNESLSSPYHQERVPELRTQTHQDFNAQEMAVYRDRLAQ